MTPVAPRPTNLALAAATLAATAIFAAGCGDDESSTGDGTAGRSAPPASSFPDPEGRTLEELLADTGAADDLVVSPAGSVYTRGVNRFGFGVFTVARDQITAADVAIYASHEGGPARGPFPAGIESLETDPAFEAKTTADDPDAAKVVYVTELELGSAGEWRLLAIRDDGGALSASRIPSVVVEPHPQIPAAGDPAPRVHTPTVEDVGDISEIDTRVPHDNMHDTDLADVLGRKPVVLLFATPALCVSRVCGPVVDVAEQVFSERSGDAAFIHMEVYEDNDPNGPARPQLGAYGLETEPWLFVIDRDGRVSTRIEGAFSVTELERALDRVTR
jgi:hypothetical protein